MNKNKFENNIKLDCYKFNKKIKNKKILKKSKENLLKSMAEIENIQKRNKKEISKTYKFAIENFALSLLSVVDSLEYTILNLDNDYKKVKEGIKLTLKQLTTILKKNQITKINPIGEKLNPYKHQAISMIKSDKEPNTIIKVLQKGYIIFDRILRPALVQVSS